MGDTVKDTGSVYGKATYEILANLANLAIDEAGQVKLRRIGVKDDETLTIPASQIGPNKRQSQTPVSRYIIRIEGNDLLKHLDCLFNIACLPPREQINSSQVQLVGLDVRHVGRWRGAQYLKLQFLNNLC